MNRRIRGWVYRCGFRPRPGTIFYSPSLALRYEIKSVDFVKAFQEGLEIGQKQVDELWVDTLCKGLNSNVCVAEGCFGFSCWVPFKVGARVRIVKDPFPELIGLCGTVSFVDGKWREIAFDKVFNHIEFASMWRYHIDQLKKI